METGDTGLACLGQVNADAATLVQQVHLERRRGCPGRGACIQRARQRSHLAGHVAAGRGDDSVVRHRGATWWSRQRRDRLRQRCCGDASIRGGEVGFGGDNLRGGRRERGCTWLHQCILLVDATFLETDRVEDDGIASWTSEGSRLISPSRVRQFAGRCRQGWGCRQQLVAGKVEKLKGVSSVALKNGSIGGRCGQILQGFGLHRNRRRFRGHG
mmetsp:Transcript_14112/g.38858  ORF Transcript_14112/g.38858 Transcript_14112/m.38858 type:complete len:214 (-) Transcript_14112:144-785(-)